MGIRVPPPPLNGLQAARPSSRPLHFRQHRDGTPGTGLGCQGSVSAVLRDGVSADTHPCFKFLGRDQLPRPGPCPTLPPLLSRLSRLNCVPGLSHCQSSESTGSSWRLADWAVSTRRLASRARELQPGGDSFILEDLSGCGVFAGAAGAAWQAHRAVGRALGCRESWVSASAVPECWCGSKYPPAPPRPPSLRPQHRGRL